MVFGLCQIAIIVLKKTHKYDSSCINSQQQSAFALMPLLKVSPQSLITAEVLPTPAAQKAPHLRHHIFRLYILTQVVLGDEHLREVDGDVDWEVAGRQLPEAEGAFVEFTAVEGTGFGSGDLVGPEVTAEVGFAVEGLSTYAAIHHLFSTLLHLSLLDFGLFHIIIGDGRGPPSAHTQHPFVRLY